MPKAVWNGKVIAESNDTQQVEGNHYFPPNAVNFDYLIESPTTSHCAWKGDCNYYTVKVDGQENKDAAWVYRNPSAEAKQIKDYIAFWKGVQVS